MSDGDPGEEAKSQPTFIPFIRTVQRIVLYETKTRFYVVGSNNTETAFRVLKIDRTEDPETLSISDDGVVYSSLEIRDLLTMIDVGNRNKVGQKVGSGIVRNISAFGIVGFVRFLEGYYVLLITKRRRVAMIGQHYIYKIEDTAMVYVPNEEEKNPDEQRYVRMFNAIDLSSNFYFSYSYDLTQTLQHNLQRPRFVGDWKVVEADPGVGTYAYASRPNSRYLWNLHLTSLVCGGSVGQDWLLPVIHGFVDQGNVSIYGCAVHLALIARRSNLFAGTRFLKRGSNFDGDVANEVETEQIVTDVNLSSLHKGRASSFVQLRGSVPGHWSQPMTAKPPIYFELRDPYGRTSGRHFRNLMKRYGSPIVAVNLMKKSEESVERDRRREGYLSDEYRRQIEYLNQFVPEEHAIQYVAFDMARCKKKRGDQVMVKLLEIGNRAVRKTGVFFSGNPSLKQLGIVRMNCVDCLDRTNTAQYVVAKSALGMQLHLLGYLPDPGLDFDCDCTRMLESMYEDHGDTLALQYGGSQLIHRIRSYRKRSKWTSKASDITQTVRRYYSNALTDAEKQNAMNVFLGAFRPTKDGIQIWDKDFVTDRYLHLRQLNNPRYSRDLVRNFGPEWFGSLLDCLPEPFEERNKSCLKLLPCNPRDEQFDLYLDCYRVFELTVMSELFQFKEVSHSVRDYMPHCSTNFSPFIIRDREVKRREDSSSAASARSGGLSSALPALLFSSWTSHHQKPGVGRASPSISYFSNDPKTSVLVGKNPSVAGTSSTASNTGSDEVEASEDDDTYSSEDLDVLSSEGDASQSLWQDPAPSRSFDFKTVFPGPQDQYGFSLKDPPLKDLDLYCAFVSVDQKSRQPSCTCSVPLDQSVFGEGLRTSMNHPARPKGIPSQDMRLYNDYIEMGRTAWVYHKKEDLVLYKTFLNNYQEATPAVCSL